MNTEPVSGDETQPRRYVSEPRPGVLGMPGLQIPEDDDGSNYPANWGAGLKRRS